MDVVAAQADWSPDGTRIAYRARRGTPQQYEISIVDLRVRDASTGRPRVTDIPRDPAGTQTSMPSWYPDGSRLVYRRTNAPVTTRSDVWTMNLDGSDRKPLVVLPEDQWYPSLSPDMTRVLFASTQPGGGAASR